MKTTVLVTGGAGFIGSHVVRHCMDMGHEVIVLDDLSGGFEDHIPQGATFVKGSVYDEVLVEELFNQYKFTYVYHLAAYAAEGLSHFIRRFNYNNNLVGSINLINESIKHKVKCFVFTSSIAVYGAGQLPMTESTVPQPGSISFSLVEFIISPKDLITSIGAQGHLHLLPGEFAHQYSGYG